MGQTWKMYAFICALLAAMLGCQDRAHAEDRVITIIYKDPEARRLLTSPRNMSGPWSSETFRRTWDTEFTDAWCKSVTMTYWSNSRHPGYSAKAHLHTNQDQDGIGFKCRKGGDNPTFISVDTMTNSQFGATIAFSLGKQLDLINWHGIKYYRGISLTTLTYERPAHHDTIIGTVPITHRGVSVDFTELRSFVPFHLPKGLKGVVGWEELRLPVDNIRVRNWNAEVRVEF